MPSRGRPPPPGDPGAGDAQVRRRGGEPETLTLVFPPGDTFAQSAEFLYGSIPGSGPKSD
jgi:hypothetical protein